MNFKDTFGHLYTVTQCENLRIFLSCRSDVKIKYFKMLVIQSPKNDILKIFDAPNFDLRQFCTNQKLIETV